MRSFLSRHPVVYLLLLLLFAFAAGPIMIAANSTSAVLYKDF